MKFWNFRRVINLVGVVCSLYLAVLGFTGKLSSFMGALAWVLVAFNMLLDFLVDAAQRQRKQVEKEARNMLETLEKLQKMVGTQCKCDDGCRHKEE